MQLGASEVGEVDEVRVRVGRRLGAGERDSQGQGGGDGRGGGEGGCEAAVAAHGRGSRGHGLYIPCVSARQGA